MAKYDKATVWTPNNAKVRGERPAVGSDKTWGVYTTAKFSGDNQWLLTGTATGIVQLWDIKNLAKPRMEDAKATF